MPLQQRQFCIKVYASKESISLGVLKDRVHPRKQGTRFSRRIVINIDMYLQWIQNYIYDYLAVVESKAGEPLKPCFRLQRLIA